MASSISCYIELELGEYGTDTYFCEEFEIEASFDFQPEEPEVRYYPDGSGYPGCPAAVEGIFDIECMDNRHKLFEELMQDESIEQKVCDLIEDQIWEQYENN